MCECWFVRKWVFDMPKVIEQNDILAAVKNNMNGGSWHGLSENDWKEIEELINSAEPTDSETKTEFPDFISNNGFIEHFHVTSGKSNRKGYDITIEESKMLKSHESFMANIDSTLPQNKNEILFSQHHTQFWRKNDSVENFHKSFKTCWDDHINHLHNYDGNKHISCFLISSDDVLSVYEHMDDDNNIFYGDLARQDRMNFCLSYDLDLLDYMYEYHIDIDYVIYFNTMRNYVEIIKVLNIPAIKEYLPKHEYELHPLMVMETSSTYGIHVPNISKGE